MILKEKSKGCCEECSWDRFADKRLWGSEVARQQLADVSGTKSTKTEQRQKKNQLGAVKQREMEINR